MIKNFMIAGIAAFAIGEVNAQNVERQLICPKLTASGDWSTEPRSHEHDYHYWGITPNQSGRGQTLSIMIKETNGTNGYWTHHLRNTNFMLKPGAKLHSITPEEPLVSNGEYGIKECEYTFKFEGISGASTVEVQKDIKVVLAHKG